MSDSKPAPSSISELRTQLIPKFIESQKLDDMIYFNEEDSSLCFKDDSSAKLSDHHTKVVFHESPLALVPSFEFSKIRDLGKCCCLCGEVFKFIHKRRASDANAKQKEKQNEKIVVSRYLQGLDCDSCSHKWCSLQCKKVDVFHSFLNHMPANSKTNNLLNLKNEKLILNYNSFNNFKKKAIAENCDLVVYGFYLILQMIYDTELIEYYQALPVSLDHEDNKTTEEYITFLNKYFDNAIDWENYYILIKESFKQPNLEEHCKLQLSFRKFLRIMLIFKLNSIHEGNMIYFLTSFIRHSCEPICKISSISDGMILNDDIEDDYELNLVVDNSIVFKRRSSVVEDKEKTLKDKTINNKNKNKTNNNETKSIYVTSNPLFKNIKNVNEWNSKARGIKVFKLFESKTDIRKLDNNDKGERLTINYLSNPPNDVFQRQAELNELYQFKCDCDRCTKELKLFNLDNDNELFDSSSNPESDLNPLRSQVDSLSLSSSSSPPYITINLDNSSENDSIGVSTATLKTSDVKITPLPTKSKSRPTRASFTSSGGSFGEGILKYNRRQVKEMLDNLSPRVRSNSNGNGHAKGNNTGMSNGSDNNLHEETLFFDSTDEEDEVFVQIPPGFNLTGRRKSVRFDDNISEK